MFSSKDSENIFQWLYVKETKERRHGTGRHKSKQQLVNKKVDLRKVYLLKLNSKMNKVKNCFPKKKRKVSKDFGHYQQNKNKIKNFLNEKKNNKSSTQ